MSTLLKTENYDGDNGTHFYIKLMYDLLLQDKTSKKSKTKYYLYTGSTDGYTGSGSPLNGYINGNPVGSITSIGKNEEVLIGTWEEEYTHDTEGKCTVSYSASAESKWNGLGNAELSGTYELPPIIEIIVKPVTVVKSFLKNGSEWKRAKTNLKENSSWNKTKHFYKEENKWKGVNNG